MEEINKPKNPIKVIMRLLSELQNHKVKLFFVLIFLVLTSVTQVAGILSLKPMLNDYLLPLLGKQNPDFTQFVYFILKIAGIYVVNIASGFIYSRIMVDVSIETLHTMRINLFQHMQKLPIQFFDTNAHGELMSRYTNDIDTLREMYSTALTQILSSFVSVVSIFIAMLWLSPILTTLVMGILLIMILAIRILGKKSSYYYGEQQIAIGKVNGYLEEMIEGQNVIKVFNHEKQAAEDFKEINDRLRVTARGSISNANYLFPIMLNLSYAHFALTAMLGALLSISSGLDLGTIGSFLQLTRNFSQPISQITQHFNTVLRGIAGGERIFAIMDMDPETDEGLVTLVHAKIDKNGTITESEVATGKWAWKLVTDAETVYTELKGHVIFDDVSFGYNPEEPVLKHISIYGQSGEKIALVGSTGAGKTTITNLLNRFYDIDDGIITYDGIDVKAIKKGDLRRSLSMVLQDTHLFTGSVSDNIRYGRLNATQDEIVYAAQLANAEEFIETLPREYDTMLSGDGGNLSQGQRQLLSIARAAVANPPALILDEATSSIDTRTEEMINVGMKRLMEGRTSFVIAHRLSTIEDADVILVLEDGEIIERGNHEALLKKQGRYYQLYTGAVFLT